MSLDEFLQDFLDEAKTHIEEIETAFLDTDAFVKDTEKINDVFRAIHSIKGTAGFFRLTTIVTLSHAMENVLGKIRSKELEFSDEVLDCLLFCNDILKQMVYNVEQSESTDISAYLKQLENLAQNKPIKTSEPKNEIPEPPKEMPQDTSTKPQEPEVSPEPIAVIEEAQPEPEIIKPVSMNISSHIDDRFYPELKKLIKKGKKIFKIAVPYNKNLQTYYKNIDKLFDEVSEIGDIHDVFTDIDHSHGTTDVTALLNSYDEKETVRLEMLITSILEYDLFLEAMMFPPEWVLHIKSGALAKKQNREIKRDETPTKILSTEESIRVSIKLLENLMALSGEMVLARNQLLNAFSNKNTEQSVMSGILQNIDSLTSKMQQEIMMTRMQPIGNIFNKFPRVIRDISKDMNKEITLNIEGKEIELDKTMIEALADPIIHLVRNSADHGLESPEEREKTGKNKKGCITLRAYHKSGLVAIEIQDDGAGIDVDAVRNKAVEKGIITRKQSETMSDSEIHKLIMEPGFSTAKSVSDISGRGVGMDVVRSNVEKLGGVVEITSKKGWGTTITLLLPRTLAIMKSLIVGCEGQRYAIPQTSIMQVVSLKEDELSTKLEHINRSKEFRLRGKLLPIINLSDILGLKKSGETASKIVVLNVFKKQMGILVHKLFDTEETLVKPLPVFLKPCIAYSGVTIMGDGKISLILDPEGLAKKSKINFKHETEEDNLSSAEREKIMLEYQSMMLFKCSGPENYAIDINMVSRVETISVSDIEDIGNEKFAKIRGKTLRVIRPENYLPVQKHDYDCDKLTVIIPNLISHPIGILVKKIVDNTKANFVLDTEQIKAPGIFGTIIHQNRIVIILNLYELFELADPINHPKVNNDIIISKRVLIVEDTPFFQHIERKYLEGTGCTVTVAENGKEALEILKEQNFDFIISDLIMPVMGGLEFIQNVRKDSKLRDIPAIALTSMTSDSYINRALDYGFDAFENKLDKVSLLKTVDSIMKNKLRSNAK